MLNIFVINLRSDVRRFERLEAQLSNHPWATIRRADAVVGGALPDDVARRLTGDPYAIIAKGALGCFLSHVRVWETLVHGDMERALVLEDDAEVREPWTATMLANAPSEADIVFVNDRTQVCDGPAAHGQSQFQPLARSLRRIVERGQAVGTDGYLLTQRGAAKLIEAVRRDGYFSHVDIRLLAYGVTLEDIDQSAPGGPMADLLRQTKSICGSGALLKAFSLTPALVEHHAAAVTSRTLQDQQGLTGAEPKPF